MMNTYQWMSDHTECRENTAGGIWLFFHIVKWMAAGIIFGLLICLGTGSKDYQNIIGASGAFFALIPGAVAGMLSLLGKA